MAVERLCRTAVTPLCEKKNPIKRKSPAAGTEETRETRIRLQLCLEPTSDGGVL